MYWYEMCHPRYTPDWVAEHVDPILARAYDADPQCNPRPGQLIPTSGFFCNKDSNILRTITLIMLLIIPK